MMDFDHRLGEEKSGNMAELAGQGMSRERLDEELAKCDVVCANCHRERTYRRAKKRLEK